MSIFRQLRKFWIPCVATVVLGCVSQAVAQTSYTVTDLGVLPGDNLGCAMALNNQGWTLTMNGLEDPISNSLLAEILSGHAAVNIDGVRTDLGTLGGTNSWMNWGGINDHGQAVGMAETSVLDPDGESFCAAGTGIKPTGLTCLPFLWQNGHMSALPTLGGNNGSASAINNNGQIVGTAQTTVPDSGCPPFNTLLPVLWEDGKAQPLPTVDGDPDGLAFALNAQGQAVGQSANCSQTIIHAVFWENGTAFPLPDFANGSIAYDINVQGQIVGTVGSADGTTQFAAIWQNGALTNLGTLPGDFAALATGINNRGQVVGSTFTSSLDWAHAFIYQNGVMTDLNTLFSSDSNLFATMANKINERGQISGMATVMSGPHKGDIHAFLATPGNGSVGTSVADVAPTRPKSNVPANVRKQFLQRFLLGRLQH